MKKLFIILSGFMTGIVLCLKDEHAAKLKKWHVECMEDTQVDPELIIKLKAGNWKIKNQLLKEWVLCLLNKYDIMSKEGVFRLDNAMSLVPKRDQEMIEDLIDACLPKYARAPEPYEIAWEYAKCYQSAVVDPRKKNKKLHYLTIFH